MKEGMAAQIIKLVVSIVICQLAGFIGSLLTTPSIPTWYASLNKPSFNPPNWVFAPVWTTLFVLMGISAYLVWNQGLQNAPVKRALIIFLVQLALNVFWSFLFFKLQSPTYAFVEITVLWIAIALTIVAFVRISRPAAFLLIPYIVWVSFAAVLNSSIARLNR
jgi:tryptophan-rich sensory protein